MGFLDHSTNNIIVDAVLTDAGRKALSRNDGSFSIYQFALGDDEVDYRVIQEFGRTVGKEKIEKNTPIMEGLTNASLALKFKNASVSNEFLTHYPKIIITDGLDASTSTHVPLVRTDSTAVALLFSIKTSTGEGIDPDIYDSHFHVEIDSRFIYINNEESDIDHPDNMSVYEIFADRQTDGSIKLAFEVGVRSFSSTVFNTFSVSNASYIRTYIKLTGVNSGITKTVEARITNA